MTALKNKRVGSLVVFNYVPIGSNVARKIRGWVFEKTKNGVKIQHLNGTVSNYAKSRMIPVK